MTKQEFVDYVNSFGRRPGEFTDDEIYQICMRGKNDLSKQDKVGYWEWVARLLGEDNPNASDPGEGLRCRVKARRKREGTLPRTVHMLDGTIVDGLDNNEYLNFVEQKKRELYIQETNTRDANNEYRALMRKEARANRLVDFMAEAADKVSVRVPLAKPMTENFHDVVPGKEAVLMLSDLHMGMTIDNFANHYNSDIACKRLAKLAKDTINSCLRNGVETLHVLNLGDLIHGIIHLTGRISQEFDVASQVMMASEAIAQFLIQLKVAAPHITYRSCTDNHSRMSADFKENIESENFNRLIDFYLIERLKNSGIEFKNDNIAEDLGVFKLQSGFSVMFTHGHRDQSQNMTNTIIGIQNALGNKVNIKYFLMGHYHSEKLKTFQFCRVIVNGSICGTDDFAYSKRLFGEPSQTLLIFDGDNLIDTRIVLDINN